MKTNKIEIQEYTRFSVINYSVLEQLTIALLMAGYFIKIEKNPAPEPNNIIVYKYV